MLDRTSNKMFGENKAVIEEILQKYLDEQELAVTHIDCEAGSKDGDNYMSLIKRVKVYFTRPSKEGESHLYMEWSNTHMHIEYYVKRSSQFNFQCHQTINNFIFFFSFLFSPSGSSSHILRARAQSCVMFHWMELI